MELQAVVFPRLNMLVDGDSNAALALLAALSLGLYHKQDRSRPVHADVHDRRQRLGLFRRLLQLPG